MEGTKDAHDEEIKRLESKTDSLKGALITRNMLVESQASKIAQLSKDLSGLQAEQKAWTSKNDTLSAELNSLKQKSSDTQATNVNGPIQDQKQTGLQKEEGKAGNPPSVSKQDPIVKN